MKKEILGTLLTYLIVLALLFVMSSGFYILDSTVGKIFFASSLIIIPIIAFINLLKFSKVKE